MLLSILNRLHLIRTSCLTKNHCLSSAELLRFPVMEIWHALFTSVHVKRKILSHSVTTNLRQSWKLQNDDSINGNPDTRLDLMCNFLPKVFNCEIHGQHRWCYKKFTIVHRLSCTPQCDETEQTRLRNEEVIMRPPRRSTRENAGNTGHLLPQTTCLLCDKKAYCSKKKGRLVKCLTTDAESSLKEAAVSLNDHRLLGMITDVDLIAKEARYHETCRDK